MTLQQLQQILYKQAAEQEDPAAKAMAGAAAVAKPSFAPAMPDFTKKPEEEGGDIDVSKELKDREKEIERLKNEKRIIEQNLQFEQIKSRQNEASRQLEQQERASLEKIRQEQQKLEQKKILSQADEVRHQSMLAKQESDSQLRIQQDKNKSLMDLHNQQLKMQMSQADKSMQMQMQAADKARATADKYKDEARKQIDKERMEMHKNYNASHSGLSPALNHTMNGAIKALSQFGKPQKIKIPKPGSSPESVSLVNPKSLLSRGMEQEAMEPKIASFDIGTRLNRIKHIPGVSGNVTVKQAATESTSDAIQASVKPAVQSTPKQTTTSTQQSTVPTQHTATDAQAAKFNRSKAKETPDSYNPNPYQNWLFGYPELMSSMLGGLLGKPFDFYRQVSKYDMYNRHDPRADHQYLAQLYMNTHNTSPTLMRMYPNAYQGSPGLASLRSFIQNNRSW